MENITTCLYANEKDPAVEGRGHNGVGGVGKIKVEKRLGRSDRRDTVSQKVGWLQRGPRPGHQCWQMGRQSGGR